MSLSRINSIPHFKNFIEEIQCNTPRGRFQLVDNAGAPLSIRKVTNKITSLIAAQTIINESIVQKDHGMRSVEFGISQPNLLAIKESVEVAIQYLDLFRFEEVARKEHKVKKFIKWLFHIKPLSDPKNKSRMVNKICRAYKNAVLTERKKIKEYEFMSPAARRALRKDLTSLERKLLSTVQSQDLSQFYPEKEEEVEGEPEPLLIVANPPPPPPPLPTPKPRNTSLEPRKEISTVKNPWIHFGQNELETARKLLKKPANLDQKEELAASS